jgi:hypothetical protein
MAREHNFLLGNGERLTFETEAVRSGSEKTSPYDFVTARRQIDSWLTHTIDNLLNLPNEACPGDEAVAVITMHPRYISKSDFPKELLNTIGLRAIGGRTKTVKPHQWGIQKHPDEAITDEIFVSGTRKSFVKWKNELGQWTIDHVGAIHLGHLENIAAFMGQDKLRSIPEEDKEIVFEFVLHDLGDRKVKSNFITYARNLGAEVRLDKCRNAQGLLFIPVKAPSSMAEELANFSFVRVARAMPQLRPFQPTLIRARQTSRVELPKTAAVDPTISVAVFDGGLPDDSVVEPWVKVIEPEDIGPSVPNYVAHGLAVTSALLFGPLEGNVLAQRPLCNVDHIRVLDSSTGDNGDYEYYDVLDRIIKTLDNARTDGHKYDFVNISLGPSIPVDDDEVTRWTASLDERFEGDTTLATVAAGNDGELDSLAGLNRVQPPSDGVNLMAIGSINSQGTQWKRASYSCVGPGRCPGIVKPDAAIFGGSSSEPFMVLTPGNGTAITGIEGTSFAAPYALRTAISVRAQLGEELGPLATRGLLIHRADLGDNQLEEVGWGRLETDYERIITCDDDEALIIYQDELPVGHFLRAPIPLPNGDLTGDIIITATLVIAPKVDPNYPNAYTRAGLEVVFRPNAFRYGKGVNGKKPTHPISKSFFSLKNLYKASEYDLRDSGHKWETCLKASKKYRASSLNQPCFDIYYNNRWNGVADTSPEPIPYALLVSVKAPRMPDFYDKVIRSYINQLVPLRPQNRIQIRR